MASGETIDVMTTSGKTVKHFLTQDVSQHVKEKVHLLSDAQIMSNLKRLHTYHIEDGSVTSIVKIVPQVLEDDDTSH